VQRYEGHGLLASPRVAVIANDALGNYAIQTSLLAMVRRELRPGHLHAVSGTRVAEFLEASELADSYWLMHGAEASQIVDHLASSKPFDLVLNLESTAMSKVAAGVLGKQGFVCGPCIGDGGRGDLGYSADQRGDLWRDKGWIAADLADRYTFLESSFIGEIFARLCYLNGTLPSYDLPMAPPSISITDVLISCSASLESKAWSEDKWRQLVNHLDSKGLSVGLLGAARAVQAELYRGIGIEDQLVDAGVHDLRGKLKLPEVVGAIASAKLVVTLDNGILHLAAATATPTVGLFRNGIHRLWAPPALNIFVLEPGDGNAVADIPLEAVLGAIER